MEMIGQELLVKRLKDDVLNHGNIRSVLFIGAKGSGRRTLAKIMSSWIGHELVDITEKIDYEYLSNLYVDVIPKVCLVNLDLLSVSAQNALLKTLEEVPEGCHFCLIAENKSSVLDTIISRCSVYEFDTYSKARLLLFLKNDNTAVLSYCRTPGDVIEYSSYDISQFVGFAEKILDKVGLANYSNILHIGDFLNWEDKKVDQKFCVDLFFKVLYIVSYNRYKNSLTDLSYKMYLLTATMLRDMKIPHINQRRIFEKYLFELRSAYDNAKTVEE